jgi:hypothetical protein
MSKYAIEKDVDLAVFEAGTKLILLEERPCAGEVIRMSKKEMFVYEFASQPATLMLKATLLPASPLVWAFDRRRRVSSYAMAAHLESADAGGPPGRRSHP